MLEDDCKCIIVSGRRGSGKTYWSVRQICEYSQKGFPVWTNVALNASADAWKRPHGPVYLLKDISQIEHMSGGLVVFDEAALLGLNSRSWKELSPRALTILANARKTKLRVIIICQAVARLDIVARELADQYLRFEKRFLGVRFRAQYGQLDVKKGNVVEYSEEEYVDEDGNVKVERKPLERFYIWLKPHFAKAYDTNATYDLQPEKKEWETIVAAVKPKPRRSFGTRSAKPTRRGDGGEAPRVGGSPDLKAQLVADEASGRGP